MWKCKVRKQAIHKTFWLAQGTLKLRNVARGRTVEAQLKTQTCASFFQSKAPPSSNTVHRCYIQCCHFDSCGVLSYMMQHRWIDTNSQSSFFWVSVFFTFILLATQQLLRQGKGAFTKYVDKILSYFDHLPPYVDIFYLIKVDKIWHFWTTYPPLLFNVVCERPLSSKEMKCRTRFCNWA